MKQKYIFLIITLFLFAGSCISVKKQTYFKGTITNASTDTFSNPISIYQLRPGDVLNIKITSLDDRLSNFFNIDQGTNTSGQASPSILYIKGYLVNDTGYVELPILGSFKAKGLTLSEFKASLVVEVNKMVSSATVVVKLGSFKVAIVGEVLNKGNIYFSNERVSVVEALANAGDIGIYGKRSSIEVIRQNLDGTFERGYLNLNDANVVHSPWFYLQPNDIVYVPPTRTLATKFNTANLTLLFASVSTFLLILNYIK